MGVLNDRAIRASNGCVVYDLPVPVKIHPGNGGDDVCLAVLK